MPGLFATAYGNVGSSIYYALGLVAAHALGLTPLVFIFAGGLFALTAKTYAEGASMFPEAGGSSSFARHAFNEVASFFAGWALTLDYIITIAISAFFVPHYLGAFLPALQPQPGRHLRRRRRDRAARGAEHPRPPRVGDAEHRPGAARSRHAGPARARRVVLVFNPQLLIDQIHLGVAPTYRELIFALSISMVAYTGIETVSNMAEEAHDPSGTSRRPSTTCSIAVLAIFAGISVIAIVALPITPGRARLHDAAGHEVPGRPRARDRLSLGLGGRAHDACLRYYVGVLAATILLIATNAGLIGISRLSWSLAQHRQLPTIFGRLHRRTAHRGSRSSSSR